MTMVFKSIWIGITRHTWRYLKASFLCYSVLWTLISSTSFFFRPPGSPPPPFGLWGLLAVISLVFGAWRSRQKREILIRSNAMDTAIRVRFGNLFDEEGLIGISVNEFFDSQLGQHVSPTSVHGQLITRFFGGHPEAFDKCVDRSLDRGMSEDVQRSTGRRWRYKIGTTAVVEANSHRFLCVALTKTDLTTLKASADVCQFWDAMRGILRKCRTEANGDGMALPLIGSGLAGIGLPPMHLLQLMILAIIEESKQAKVCTEIRIVLPENRFDQIDLASIEHLWS